MPEFIKSSVVLGAVMAICRTVVNSYDNSRLKIAVSVAVKVCASSCTYNIIKKYINKKPYFLYSGIYKLERRIVRLIDKMMDVLNGFFAKMINNSIIFTELKMIPEIESRDKLSMVAIILMSICIGFMTGKIAMGQSSTEMLVSVWAVFIMGGILAVCGNCRQIIKNSLIYRFFNWLVKM